MSNDQRDDAHTLEAGPAPSQDGAVPPERLVLSNEHRVEVASGNDDAPRHPPLVLRSAQRVDDGDGAASPEAEAIRRLVQEIVEEQLAGQLGARITQGVRKLVREEVGTILAARDAP